MGLHAIRSFNYQNRFISFVNSTLSEAKDWYLTHEQILEKLKERIYDSPHYQKSPERVKSYIAGYLKARFDELYRYELEWRMWVSFGANEHNLIQHIHKSSDETKFSADLTVGGNLLTRNQIELLQRSSAFDDAWRRIDNNKSKHTWKGRPDKIF